jgi:hypothetical protein
MAWKAEVDTLGRVFHGGSARPELSLPRVFSGDCRRLRNLLCAGGVHFEPAFAEAVFQTWDDQAYGVSHILANQWLASAAYEAENGAAKLAACVGMDSAMLTGVFMRPILSSMVDMIEFDKLLNATSEELKGLSWFEISSKLGLLSFNSQGTKPMEYIAKSAGIADSSAVLIVGCGAGGTAVRLAEMTRATAKYVFQAVVSGKKP